MRWSFWLYLILTTAAGVALAAAAAGEASKNLPAAVDVIPAPSVQAPAGAVDVNPAGEKPQLAPPAAAGVTAPPPAGAPAETVDPERFGDKKRLDPA